jgi:predicted PurR-regulated permease PerM
MNQQVKPTPAKEGAQRLARSIAAPSGLAQAAGGQVQVDQPSPPASNEETWTTIRDFAVIAIAFVVFITALYHSRSILMPVLAAVLIGLTLAPLQKRAAAHKIPGVITSLVLMALFFGALYLLFILTVGPLTDWLTKAPELGATVREKLQWLDRPLATIKELGKSLSGGAAETSPKVAVETTLPDIVRQGVKILTPAVTELLIFIGTMMFFLIGHNKLRRQLITTFETRDARLRVVRIWSDIEHNLVAYLTTVTMINLCLGLVTTALLYVLDFPNPAAFGVLAFVLNYIPYIGPAIVVLALFLVGVVTLPTLGAAFIPPLLFVAITTVEGHFITPGIVGRKLTLSPFLVFLALAFWTWLWGPLGAFMAVPLLIVGLVVLSHLFPSNEQSPLPG